MITEFIPSSMAWIRWAEMRYGMYNDRTAKVRRYFLWIVEPDKFPEVPEPQELKDLGYPDLTNVPEVFR